jgi:hypothetical protein
MGSAKSGGNVFFFVPSWRNIAIWAGKNENKKKEL